MPGIGKRQLSDSDTIKTLIITGHTDIHHDWRTMSPMLAELLTGTGAFDVRITEEFRGASSETLEPYDLVVLNYFGRFEPWGHAPEKRWGTSAEQALYDFVAAGKGVVVYHASLQMGAGWGDDFEKMAGGVLREECSRRAPINDFRLHVKAPDHPVTAGMPSSFPHYDDDLYVNLRWDPSADVEVLISGWDNPLRYTQVPSEWNALPGMGDEHPIVWTNRYGEGRVYATGIGHGPEAVSHPSFRGLFVRGAEWAATGKVTLGLPDGFGEPVPGGDWWPTTLEPMVREMYESRQA
ncbi:ThuA domain-containing protein [Cryptosporangium japonicum]|uniref:ThuA domain-containing protein n=1 Tax=Cryptosporangium japonicum TaxID=80872 RepID=A0ABN0UFP3_9ACTN